MGSIPGSGRYPGEGNGNPLQYSCLENPTDRGAWRAAVHGDCQESNTSEQLNTTTWCSCLQSSGSQRPKRNNGPGPPNVKWDFHLDNFLQLKLWLIVCVCVCVLGPQPCPTLCDLMDCSPARLLGPRDSPGKNTGVSCHALLQGGLPDPGIEPGSPLLQAEASPPKLVLQTYKVRFTK